MCVMAGDIWTYSLYNENRVFPPNKILYVFLLWNWQTPEGIQPQGYESVDVVIQQRAFPVLQP